MSNCINTNILDIPKGMRYCVQLLLVRSFLRDQRWSDISITLSSLIPSTALGGRPECGPIYRTKFRESEAVQDTRQLRSEFTSLHTGLIDFSVPVLYP